MKYLCIDTEILYNEELSSSEKIILASVFALDKKKVAMPAINF